jgi:hypothetical protein
MNSWPPVTRKSTILRGCGGGLVGARGFGSRLRRHYGAASSSCGCVVMHCGRSLHDKITSRIRTLQRRIRMRMMIRNVWPCPCACVVRPSPRRRKRGRWPTYMGPHVFDLATVLRIGLGPRKHGWARLYEEGSKPTHLYGLRKTSPSEASLYARGC